LCQSAIGAEEDYLIKIIGYGEDSLYKAQQAKKYFIQEILGIVLFLNN
jgi:hypothetical protein